jgi:putative aminopeptidase FrvX
MSYPSRRRFAAAAAILAAATLAFAGDIKVLVKDIYPIPSVTGNEAALAAKIASMLPKSLTVERDGLGSLYARLGSGGPIIAAGLDEFGYVVSGITAEGYLTLDRAVAPPVPIYDSFLFGHPVVIGTKAGPLSGVVSQPAMHVLTRERREQLSLGPWLDWVFVDVAARNEDEVRGRGIEILDPISFKPNLAETLAAVLAAQAVLTAQPAEPNKKPAAAQFVWMAQSRFPARGSRASLGAFRARAQLTGKTAIILDIIPADRGEKSPVFGKGIVLLQAKEGPSKLRDAVEAAAVDCKIPLQLRTGSDSPLLAPFLAEGGDAVILALAVRYAGTPAETIDMAEANQLVTLLGALLETGRIR